MKKHACPICGELLVDIDDNHIQHYCPVDDKYFYVIRKKIMNEEEYVEFYQNLQFFNKKVKDEGRKR